MPERKFQFGPGEAGSALPVKVTPRARRNEIVGFTSEGTLRIRVTAPPVEGAANEAVIELLADALNLPKSKVDVVAGLTGTQKLVSVIGLKPAEVDERLRRKKAAAGRRGRKQKKSK